MLISSLNAKFEDVAQLQQKGVEKAAVVAMYGINIAIAMAGEPFSYSWTLRWSIHTG